MQKLKWVSFTRVSLEPNNTDIKRCIHLSGPQATMYGEGQKQLKHIVQTMNQCLDTI